MSGQVTFGRLASQGGEGGGGEGAFRILVIGDFSGRTARGMVEPIAGRRTVAVDVDNWEDVLGSLGAEIRIPAGGAEIAFAPREIDDFHPDFLHARLGAFRSLRDLRKRLASPEAFEAAAAEVRSWHGARGRIDGREAATTPAGSEQNTGKNAQEGGKIEHQKESDGDTLGRLLGDRPAGADEAGSGACSGGSSAVDSLIQAIVGPYVVPDRTGEQAALVACVDDATAGLMRAILHHPTFQALEAAWRGIEFLVTHLETDEDLRIAILDASKNEIAADVRAADDLSECGLHETLVARTHGTPGGKPWALLCLADRLDNTAADADLLGRLAKIARAARAPLVAGATDRLAGCESIAAEPDPRNWSHEADADAKAAWDALRKLPEARWAGLGMPRMLLRAPYGEASNPTDAFDFEEFAGPAPHEQYLWGPASLAMAEALGEAFAENGWAMGAELFCDVADLPTYVFRDADGDKCVQPCAEVLLTDRAAGAILGGSLTALMSVRGRNVIRIRGVAAIADPPAALAGPWG